MSQTANIDISAPRHFKSSRQECEIVGRLREGRQYDSSVADTELKRFQLEARLDETQHALVVGGIGLGKTTLLRHYASSKKSGEAVYYSTTSEDHVLGAFLAGLTHAVMRTTQVRLFEGADSKYANRPSEVQPELYAELIAADLGRYPNPLTVIIDQIHPAPHVLALLGELLRLVAPHVRFILSGPETLTRLLPLPPHLTVIGPGELAFRAADLRSLEWDAWPELRGLPGLMALRRIGPQVLTQFAQQMVAAIRQLEDGDRLITAGLLDTWSEETPIEVLGALDLPADYLQQFRQASFSLPGPLDGQVTPPTPALEALKTVLRSENSYARYAERLAHVYGAHDPVRAYILRRSIDGQGDLQEREAVLSFARARLPQWLADGAWEDIHRSLSLGVWQTFQGLRFALDGDEALILARAIYETASSLDDLRLALNLIAAAESVLIVRQPHLGDVKGLVLLRLGRIDRARIAFEELLPYVQQDERHYRRILCRATLCYLRLDEAAYAWANLRLQNRTLTGQPDCFFFAVFAAAALSNREVGAAQQALLEAELGLQPDDSEAIAVMIQVYADLGEVKRAREFIELLPVHQPRPWPRMEARYARSLVLFREQNFIQARNVAEEAMQETRGLSAYASRPEPEYQDLSYLVRVYLMQFLCAVRLIDLPVADRIIRRLDDLMVDDPSLQRRVRLCRHILSASLGTRTPPNSDLQAGLSELELVAHLLREPFQDAQRLPYPPGVLQCWRYWNPLARPLDYCEIVDEQLSAQALAMQESVTFDLPRQLVLRCLGTAPSARLNEQELKLNLRQHAVLAALAESPRTSSELTGLLFSGSAPSYLGVVLNSLTKLCRETNTTPLHILKDGKYQLAPDLEVICDLQQVRYGPVSDLPRYYTGPLAEDAPWLSHFVTASGLRREIVVRIQEAQRDGTKISPVIRALAQVDPEFTSLFRVSV